MSLRLGVVLEMDVAVVLFRVIRRGDEDGVSLLLSSFGQKP